MMPTGSISFTNLLTLLSINFSSAKARCKLIFITQFVKIQIYLPNLWIKKRGTPWLLASVAIRLASAAASLFSAENHLLLKLPCQNDYDEAIFT
jgi:hypothetical protein